MADGGDDRFVGIGGDLIPSFPTVIDAEIDVSQFEGEYGSFDVMIRTGVPHGSAIFTGGWHFLSGGEPIGVPEVAHDLGYLYNYNSETNIVWLNAYYGRGDTSPPDTLRAKVFSTMGVERQVGDATDPIAESYDTWIDDPSHIDPK